MAPLRLLIARLRNVFARPDDPGFDVELREHLRQLTERYIRQGMTPDTAARAARRQFGNITLLREERRQMQTMPMLESFWQDARFGARSLCRSPGLATVIVLTLMLGIGVNAGLFAVIYAVLIKPFPYRDPDRLEYINDHQLTDGVGVADLLEWR
jgi:hypothetical protein